MERRDWTLLAIAAGQRPLTPVQLQKSLFLLGTKMPEVVGGGFYRFRPYNYGPFTVTVYEDAEALERDGLVAIDRSAGRRSWPTYATTPAGVAAADDIPVPDAARQYLSRVLDWAQTLTFRQLVGAIYDAFPEQRENSVFSN